MDRFALLGHLATGFPGWRFQTDELGGGWRAVQRHGELYVEAPDTETLLDAVWQVERMTLEVAFELGAGSSPSLLAGQMIAA